MFRFFKRSRAQRAFILVEILAAVVVMGITLTFIVQALTAQLRACQFQQDATLAVFLMENKLTELWREGVTAKTLTSEERALKPLDRFHTKVKSSALAKDFAKGLKQTEAQVFWPSGKNERQWQVMTFIKGEDAKQTTTSVFYN